MKKMIYSADRKIEVLDTGYCFGLLYYILNLGTYPTAYIRIPENHKYYQKNYDEVDLDLGVNFGLTYSNYGLYISKTEKIEGWFIGWDYGHYLDYCGYEERMPVHLRSGGKKWTTEEIFKEVKEACYRIVNEAQNV